MKIIFALVVIFGCSYVGFGMSKTSKSKVVFYQDLMLFCSGLKNYICFFNLKLEKIFQTGQMGYAKDFGYLCEIALSSIDCGKSDLIDVDQISKIKFLSSDECQTIAKFFSILGKSDEKNQSKQMEIYEKIFFEYFENAKENFKSKGTLYGKLGVYTGLFVAILCL